MIKRKESTYINARCILKTNPLSDEEIDAKDRTSIPESGPCLFLRCAAFPAPPQILRDGKILISNHFHDSLFRATQCARIVPPLRFPLLTRLVPSLARCSSIDPLNHLFNKARWLRLLLPSFFLLLTHFCVDFSFMIPFFVV